MPLYGILTLSKEILTGKFCEVIKKKGETTMDYLCIFNLMAQLHAPFDQDVVDTCNKICAILGHEH